MVYSWLLHTSEKEKVIVFAADSDLQLAAQCDTLVGDATFKISPKGFRQLYTVHAKVLFLLTDDWLVVEFPISVPEFRWWNRVDRSCICADELEVPDRLWICVQGDDEQVDRAWLPSAVHKVLDGLRTRRNGRDFHRIWSREGRIIEFASSMQSCKQNVCFRWKGVYSTTPNQFSAKYVGKAFSVTTMVVSESRMSSGAGFDSFARCHYYHPVCISIVLRTLCLNVSVLFRIGTLRLGHVPEPPTCSTSWLGGAKGLRQMARVRAADVRGLRARLLVWRDASHLVEPLEQWDRPHNQCGRSIPLSSIEVGHLLHVMLKQVIRK